MDDYKNAVYKHTYNKRKGRTFDLFRDHLTEINYDRKIWMARDPRDIAVSEMLYRWHKGPRRNRKQYRAHLKLVQKKELNPGSIPFHVLCRYIGYGDWPMTTEEVLERERVQCQRMHDFVKSIGNNWFIFRYEDMIDKNFDALNEYLGFKIKDEAEIPMITKKSKVARKKAYGDWRIWYTEEDVELYKPVYLPYMELIGYDCDDWTLNPEAVIKPEFSSMYIKKLVHKNTLNTIRSFRDSVLRRSV